MSVLKRFETLIESVQLTGKLYDKPAQAFSISGRRAGFTSLTVFNDVGEFANTVADFPELSNSTLDIISSSANDNNTSGTGVRRVRVVYLNTSDNIIESAEINLNGTTLVTSVLTGVNFVLWMEATLTGTGNRAAGNIRLRINGGTVEVEQITAGSNKSLSARFKIPAGYTGYLSIFRAHAILATQDVRLLAQVNSLDRSLSTVYKVQASLNVPLNTNSSLLVLPFLPIPALAKIKLSTLSGALPVVNQCDTSFSLVIVQN